MNGFRIKVILIHVLGFVSGYISFFGLHPFGVAYLSALIMETNYGLSVLLTIAFGMLFSCGIMKFLKYILILGTLLYLTKLLSKHLKISGRACTSLITAGLVFFMDLIGEGMLAIAIAEALLVTALSIIMTYIPFNKTIHMSVYSQSSINDPQKARLCESAEVFSKLSQCFSELPFQKNSFNKADLERMSRNVYQDFCIKCTKSDECWKQNCLDTEATCSHLFEAMAQGYALNASMVKGRIKFRCMKLNGFLNALTEVYDQAQIHLFWYNRLIEHREAVADQLDEMANMIAVVAEEVYDNDKVDDELEEMLKAELKNIHMKLDRLSVIIKKDGREEYFISGHSNLTKYVSAREVSAVLSRLTERKMIPSKDSKTFYTETSSTISFIERPTYKAICKSARVIKSGQSVSGDNYMFLETEDGQAIACISDGMGSGVMANKESETVVELMERFIEAGFSKETAVKMINSTMVLTDGEPSCSTVDICAMDLYEGCCDFIKMGAVPSYLKREHYVERISLSSVPMGVSGHPDYELSKKDLYDGDFIIMISDGILEAFGSEESLERLITKLNLVNPTELSNAILAGALGACGYNPGDDMTVLVISVLKN